MEDFDILEWDSIGDEKQSEFCISDAGEEDSRSECSWSILEDGDSESDRSFEMLGDEHKNLLFNSENEKQQERDHQIGINIISDCRTENLPKKGTKCQTENNSCNIPNEIQGFEIVDGKFYQKQEEDVQKQQIQKPNQEIGIEIGAFDDLISAMDEEDQLQCYVDEALEELYTYPKTQFAFDERYDHFPNNISKVKRDRYGCRYRKRQRRLATSEKRGIYSYNPVYCHY